MKKTLKSAMCCLLASMLLLTGCGQSAPATDDKAPEESKKTEEAAPAEERDTLIYGLGAEPTSLDPSKGGEIVTYMYMGQFYDTLIRETQDGQYVPSLAESWEYSEDGKEMTFKLKEGVKFHNGDVMTAEDVEYSFNRVIASSYSKKNTNMMDHMEVVDPTHVKLFLKFPYAAIDGCISTSNMGIVPKKVVEADEEAFERNPVGTGPYVLKEWKNGEKLVLERFEDYWRGPAPIKNVIFKILTDKSTSLIALEKGEIDVLDGVAQSDKKRIQNNPDLVYAECPSTIFYHVVFNCKEGMFTNKKLRQAISYAIDREAMILGALDGGGAICECPVSPASFGYQPDFHFNPYDVEKAKELLAEAGYPDGLHTTIKTIQSPGYLKPAEIFQDQLKAIGIEADIEIMERAAYLSDVYRKCDYELTLWMVSPLVPDADFSVFSRLHSSVLGNGNNYSLYVNPEMDKLIDEARSINDKDRRMELYGQVSELVREDCPIIPIMSMNYEIAHRNYVKNVVPHSTGKYFIYDWHF